MTNTNKATELATMMAEEFKIMGASFNRLAEHMENLLAVVLEEKTSTPAPVVKEVTPAKEEKKAEKKSGKPTPKVKEEVKEVEPVEEEETEEADGEEEEEGLTLEELQEMSLKELKELATENEVEFPKGVKKPALLKLLEEAFFSEEEEEEVEEVDEEIGEEEEIDSEEETEEEEVSTVIETEDGDIDLAEMNVKQLKAFADEYGLDITAKKKDGIIAEILEQIYADDEEAEEEEVEEEEDGEDVAEQLGLNDMELEELAEILSENGLSTKGKKQALIDRIVRGIESGDIEVDEEGE